MTKYTMKNAAMSLADARDILSTPEKGWSPSQIARAKVVAARWTKIRTKQAKAKEQA